MLPPGTYRLATTTSALVAPKCGEHLRHQRRRVAEVGVHDADDCCATSKPGDDCGAQPEFAGPMHDPKRVRPRSSSANSPSHRGIVVDDDHLRAPSPGASRAAPNSLRHEFRQPIALVVGGNDDRQIGRQKAYATPEL